MENLLEKILRGKRGRGRSELLLVEIIMSLLSALWPYRAVRLYGESYLDWCHADVAILFFLESSQLSVGWAETSVFSMSEQACFR